MSPDQNTPDESLSRETVADESGVDESFVVDERTRQTLAADVHLLNSLGYGQELARRMSGFSNFAISLSIICILAGGITSFPEGFGSVGGAAIGIGWPACCLLSLCVALAMAQLASAFPTAGGLYHWAAILGGRGWGWLTAWFNLAGLITVLAAINVGTYQFSLRALANALEFQPDDWGENGLLIAQVVGVLAITVAQAVLNHGGIRLTAALTDFSGYWILLIAAALTAAMLAHAPPLDFSRLITFSNYSGLGPADKVVWPATSSVAWLFLLGFLLPAYTVTGFDASAHTAEETVGSRARGAARHHPLGVGLGAVWLGDAVGDCVGHPEYGRGRGERTRRVSLHRWPGAPPRRIWLVLAACIAIAQFLCGLATVTSASRMAYAFARDGGLPFSKSIRRVSPKFRTPAIAIWTVSLLSVAFVVHTRTYSTITGACTMFLYISYAIPTALGLAAYGRTWKTMGPWHMSGPLYRAMAVLSIAGCGLILLVGVQPPNEQNRWTVLAGLGLTAIVWLVYERSHFRGPPQGVLDHATAAVKLKPRT